MTIRRGRAVLALIAPPTGINKPLEEAGATAYTNLDSDQRAIVIGEPVPIVFARWRNDAGGILISPGATELRFENDANNSVTAYYHLPISEGEIDPIPVKDVFQRSCRVGTHYQTYDRRAGLWEPGNFIVQRAGYERPEASYYCGSVGQYPGISTVSFQVTVPDGFDFWRRQVHLFIRGGMHVTRLYDSTEGPSDNFADLVHWMLRNSSRVPSALIDTTALTEAATFLEANGLTCNCYITESSNYSDFISEWAPYFLLGESSKGGKKGLRPLLPINADGTINTGVIDWSYIFTEDTILPGSFEVSYITYDQRQPFVAQMTWRQELGVDAAVVRTSEVRIAGTAEAGPYESHDLSAFCTSEDHAVKVGTYAVLRRRHVSHTVRFSTRPQAHNRLISVGDIVRVLLTRQATAAGTTTHDYLYQVERITKTLAGDVSYECVHFPINEEGQSIVALGVANAVGTGYLFTGNRTGVSCDASADRAFDETLPEDIGRDLTHEDYEDWEPEDWPTDENGDPIPWPTDEDGDLLPFDDQDPSFDDFTDVPLGPDGLPTVELGPDALPSDAGIDGAFSGGASTDIGGSLGPDGTPQDSPSDGPIDDDANPDDDKDPQPDSPFDEWPSGYPTPLDPDWPFDPNLPVNSPGAPTWLSPATPSSIPPEPEGEFITRITVGPWNIDVIDTFDCTTVLRTQTISAFTNEFTDLRFLNAVFMEVATSDYCPGTFKKVGMVGVFRHKVTGALTPVGIGLETSASALANYPSPLPYTVEYVPVE